MAFLDDLWPTILKAAQATGVDPRIIGAQAALESNYGKSAPGNNLFGIKGGNGPSLATTEVVNGQPVRTSAQFRQYASPADSVVGYANFINSNPRYEPFREAQGLDAQIAALGKSGYATDPNYAEKIRSIAVNLPAPPVGPAPSSPAGGARAASEIAVPMQAGTAYQPSPLMAALGMSPGDGSAILGALDGGAKSPLSKFFDKLSKFPDGPQARSQLPMPSAENGDALMKWMQNPNPFTDFFKKFRYQGIG